MIYTIIYELENNGIYEKTFKRNDAAMREVTRMKEAIGSSLLNCRIQVSKD